MLTSGLVLIVTLVAFESLAISTVMPLVEDDLGDLWLYGWVFSAFFLGNLIGIVVAGTAADRMRPAIPFAAGLVVFAIGLVVGGLAPTMLVLVLGRALQGLGAGAMPAISYVCIGRGYPHEQRPTMFALISSAWVIPSVAGPALAGVIGSAVGWRWVFLGLLPLCGVIGAAGTRRRPGRSRLPTSPRGSRTCSTRVMVAAGAALVLAGFGAGICARRDRSRGGRRRRRPPCAAPPRPAGHARRPPRACRPRCCARRADLRVLRRRRLRLVRADHRAGPLRGGRRRRPHRRHPHLDSGVVAAGPVARPVRRRPRSWPSASPRVALGSLAMLCVLVPSVPPAAVGISCWSIAGFGIGLAYAPLSVVTLPRGCRGPGRPGHLVAATVRHARHRARLRRRRCAGGGGRRRPPTPTPRGSSRCTCSVRPWRSGGRAGPPGAGAASRRQPRPDG